MQLKEVWEYYIAHETFSGKVGEQGEFKATVVIAGINPIGGWSKVFQALEESGEFKNQFTRITNASCCLKKYLIL